MTVEAPAPTKIPTRDEIEEQYRWDLEAIFATPEEWDRSFRAVEDLVEPILKLKGKLSSPSAVATLFAAQDALGLQIDRLYAYAHHREDEDTTNSVNQARIQRIRARATEIFASIAWVTPEILSQPLNVLQAWRDSSELAAYRRSMEVLIREKPHVLSDTEETLLSMAGEIFSNPRSTFGYLVNADMKFPDVEDDKGTKQPLTNGRYVTFMENRDRAVRRRAFETLYDTYGQFGNTLASTLSGNVKYHTFNAKVRKFSSALDASLFPDSIPQTLYDTLIEATHEALPAFHDYIDLRREVLGLDAVNMWDMHVPIVPNFDMKVDWAKACEWVRESCAPMGKEYMRGVEKSLTDRWIDVYENKGKRSGAYSGGCYGSPAYMLMNYQGTLDWVFTLAHELGHSMHTWLAGNTQPYRYAEYTIFVAEIASTANEALLHDHLLKTTDDPRFKAYLLNHLCDQFRGTVYRQTMFAEFEKLLHEMDGAGEPLTAESIGKAYYDLNAKFHGPAVKADERIAREWSRIPHFYYNFYVYKYATGFCASQVFSRRILESTQKRDQYLDFLKGGGSADPLELVKRGGVDLTSREVLTSAFATFRKSVAELRQLLVG
jgi:oligoendopeptidase F